MAKCVLSAIARITGASTVMKDMIPYAEYHPREGTEGCRDGGTYDSPLEAIEVMNIYNNAGDYVMVYFESTQGFVSSMLYTME